MKHSLRERFEARFTLEQRLAMNFTRLVCVLILASGLILMTGDTVIFYYRMMHGLNVQVDQILADSQISANPATAGPGLNPSVRPFLRILAPDGTVLYQGEMFAGSSTGHADPFAPPKMGGDSYSVVTRPIYKEGGIVGFVQFAGHVRQGPHEFGWEILELLVVTVLMGALSYILGLRFSRHTLRPVHESQGRLEQFTQDASHELRTPLASISSSLDVAMKTGEYRDGIMAAKGQVKYASLLVERLLEVAQLDRAKVDLGQVDLTALVTAVASQNVESCKEHEVTMQATIGEGVTVEGDSLLLRQLVNNLIENAVKFNAPGGMVSVVLNATDLHVGNSRGFIAPDDLSHVFEPFYQVDTSRTQRGFGLGLAIVKKIADLHGWHVTVTSNAEAGTDFIVRFT
jgi:signal transduction histidine kinase